MIAILLASITTRFHVLFPWCWESRNISYALPLYSATVYELWVYESEICCQKRHIKCQYRVIFFRLINLICSRNFKKRHTIILINLVCIFNFNSKITLFLNIIRFLWIKKMYLYSASRQPPSRFRHSSVLNGCGLWCIRYTSNIHDIVKVEQIWRRTQAISFSYSVQNNFTWW